MLVIGLILIASVITPQTQAGAQDVSARFMADYGNVTVMEVTGNFDEYTSNGTPNTAPRQAIAKEFFRTHKDEYDFVTIFTNFDFTMKPNAVAFYSQIKNDVHGIGQQIYDNSALYGSNGKLQGTIDMGNLLKLANNPLDPKFDFTTDIMIHENLHRWGAYVKFRDWNGTTSEALLGNEKAHWSFLFDSGGSTHYGNKWRDNGDGTFTSTAVRKYYSPQDLYVMGMLDKSKVPPTLLIDNPAIAPTQPSELGATISGTARSVTIDDISAVEGERIPSFKDSQKQFKTAFIYVVTPGTFSADDLPAIENIRNAYLTRFSILTDGKGLVQVASTPLENLPTNPGVHTTATVPRTLPPNINDGLSWLINRQQADGSWTDFALTTERDTAESVATLQIFPTAQSQFQTGLNWLGTNGSTTTDYLARRIEARVHVGNDSTAMVQELLARRNSDGGWGGGRNFVSSSTDTALALKALAAAGYSDQIVTGKAIAYLQNIQNPDGGWSGDTSASIIQPTAAVLSAYNAYRKNYDLETGIGKAVVFLAAKQNTDGGFGNSPSTVYDSSLALMALQSLNADKSSITKGMNYLLGQQAEDGSWNESPFQTALSMRAVWQATVEPDLSIKAEDISIIPATTTTLPTNAVLSATIQNLGRSDVSQAKVAVYDGVVSPSKKVAEQIVAFPGQSPVTLTFSIPVTDSKGHLFYVVVDPDNQLVESNKNNNNSTKSLLPEITYDFQVQAADITVSPSPANVIQDVKIAFKVTNRGTSDAYSVPVKIFIDQPGTPLEIALLSMDIAAGGSISKEVTWRASLAGANMPLSVQIDPNNTFKETNKANNSAFVPLTVNGSTMPNLSVSYKDMVITPSPAREGGSASISVLVKNDGFATTENVKVIAYKGVASNGGTLLGSQIIPAIPAGQSVLTTINWTGIAENGEQIISVQVDPDNAIQEISKDDNFTFTTLNILNMPDLAISSNSIVLTPSAPKEGDAISIAVTVQNNGEQEASNVAVRVLEGATVVGTAVIPVVNSNSQATATIIYLAGGQTGVHQISVIVDPDNLIAEQSKTNNSAVKSFNVQNANLSVSEPYFSPNGDGIKDTTDFSFRMVASAKVSVQVVNKKGAVVRTFSGGELDNTAGTVVIWDGKNYGGTVVGDGEYQIKLIDANNVVLGSLFVVVDNNRSMLTDAFGTKYLLTNPLTNGFGTAYWTQDESNLVLNKWASSWYYDVTNEWVNYSLGLDSNVIIPLEWVNNTDPIFTYTIEETVLSPDSEKLALIIHKNPKIYGNGQSTNEVVIINKEGSDFYTVTSVVGDYIVASKRRFFDLKWSPDGNWLQFQQNNTAPNDTSIYSNTDVWLANKDNNSKFKIGPTNFGGGISYVTSWSSDSRKISYISGNEIWLVDVESRSIANVETVNGATISKSIWMPSEGKYAYGIKYPDHLIVRTVDSFGAKKDVMNQVGQISIDEMEPLNGKIVVLMSGSLGYQLWTLDLSESNNNKILATISDNNSYIDGPYVSPDKKLVAYNISSDEDSVVSLYVADSQGNVTNLMVRTASKPNWNYFGDTKWSYDSSKIAIREAEHDDNTWYYIQKYTAVDVNTKKITSVYMGADSWHDNLDGWLSDNKSVLFYSFKYENEVLFDTESGTVTTFRPNDTYVEVNKISPSGNNVLLETFQPNSLNSLITTQNLIAYLNITKTKTAITLKGIAQDLNFEGYKLEYADSKSSDTWGLISPPSDMPVMNDTFATWIPPYDGTFFLRLTVWDKAGNTAISKKRVAWGSHPPLLTNMYKSLDLFSPNGDGIKDTVELNYRVLAPAHLEFGVYDEANNLVRTFVKEHPAQVSDFILWDGRDESGRVVPDGKYKFKIFDYEFSVEVDSVLPNININLSAITSAYDANTKQNYYQAQLTAAVSDTHIKQWAIQTGEGENPQQWTDYVSGTDNKPNFQNNFTNQGIAFLKNKRFRIVAEDFAGNKNIAITNLVENSVVFMGYVAGATGVVFNSGGIPSITLAKGLSYALSGFETAQMPTRKIVLQLSDGTEWRDSLEQLGGGYINFSWHHPDNTTKAYALRFKIVTESGIEFFSREVKINEQFKADYLCSGLFGFNYLVEKLQKLEVKVTSPWGKTASITYGNNAPTGTFGLTTPQEVQIQSNYTVSMKGIGVSGLLYSFENTVSQPKECKTIENGDLSIENPLNPIRLQNNGSGGGNVIPFDVIYPDDQVCGQNSHEIQLPTSRLPVVGAKRVSYFVKVGDNLQMIGDVDIEFEGYRNIAVDTSILPEGSYSLSVIITNKDNSQTQMDLGKMVVVDREAPKAQLTLPSSPCPIRFATTKGNRFGVEVSGNVTDNIKVSRYALYYGVGDNPTSWLPAMSMDNSGVVKPIAGDGAISGRLGTWDITDISGTLFTLKLEVVDGAGNKGCATGVVRVDREVKINNFNLSSTLISPNNDGKFDTVTTGFSVDEPVTVNLSAFNLVKDINGAEILGTSQLSRIQSNLKINAGMANFNWDGKGDATSVLADGRYGAGLTVTDVCGNTASQWKPIEIDNTQPTVSIDYPRPADTLSAGIIVEIKGTVSDPHFKSYILEAGAGDNPTAWISLATSDKPTTNNIITAWNTSGLKDHWTLRLSAEDTVGNKNVFTSTINLGVRKELIKSLDANPKLFSPNSDQKLDSTVISYEVTDACDVKIDVLDINSLPITTYTTVINAAGKGSFIWDGKNGSGAVVSDGSYQVKLTALLTSNPSVTQTETLTLTVDTTQPLIDIKQLVDKANLNLSSFGITGTIADQNLKDYSISVAGSGVLRVIDSGNQARNAYSFGTVSDLAEGDYTLTAKATDLGENGAQIVRTFTIDRTPPKISLDTPKNNEYYGSGKNVIDITGLLVEKNLERYSLRYGVGDAPVEWKEVVGGNTVPTVAKLISWKVGKDDGIADGAYTLSLYAKDKAGLEGEAKVKIVIDNTSPEVAISTPKDGDYVTKAIDIKGTAFDVNLDKAQLELSEGDCSSAFKWTPLKTLSTSLRESLLTSWQTLPADGSYCQRLSATDKVGNKTEVKINVKVDTHPPATPVLSGKIEAKTGVRLDWPRNTETDMAGYNVYRDGQKLNSSLITDIFFIDVNLKEGNYAYSVKAVDLAGNESGASNAVTLRVNLTGPTVRITTPATGGKVNDLVDIKGTAFSSYDFKEYRVFIGQGSAPVTWTLIRKSPLSTSSGMLAQWDTFSLTEGVYSVKLEAEDLSGNVSVQTISVNIDNTPPLVPQLLTAVANVSDVTVTWKANIETDLAGYLVYRNDQLASSTGLVVRSLKPFTLSGTSYIDKALPDGKYVYTLAAIDQAGNVSGLSNPLSVVIDVQPPHATIVDPVTGAKFEGKTLVRAESVGNDTASIQFRYKKPLDSVWKNVGGAVTSSPYATTLDPKAIGLTYGDFQLQALATDQGGKTDPSPTAITVTYTDLTPPVVPTGLKTVINGGNVSLSWDANTEPDLDGYNVYRTSGSSRTKLNSVTLKTAGYQDTNLADGLYGYDITAVDTFGNESKSTSPVSMKIYAPILTQPLTPIFTTTVKVTGSGAVPNVMVELFTTVGTVQTSAGSVSADLQGNFVIEGIPLSLGENKISARTRDAFGNISKMSAAVSVIYRIPPSAPQGLVATATGTSINLSWLQTTESSIAGYNLYKKAADGWLRLNSVLLITPPFSDQPLKNGIYVYRITAVDTEGIESVPSAEATATVSVPVQALPPQNLRVAPATEGKTLDLAWDPSTGTVAGYVVYRSLSSGGQYRKITQIPLLRLTYQDFGLINGITYYYVVTALDAAGNESLYSNEVSSILLDSTPPSRPVLSYPTIPGVTKTLFAASIDVSGMADPGSGIELIRNGDSAGSTTSAIEDKSSVIGLPQGATYPTISADNAIIAYFADSTLWLKVQASGETIRIDTPNGKSVPGSFPAAISPDGNKIIFEYFTSTGWQTRLALFDRRAGVSVPFTDDQNVTESNVAWSHDGKNIAFFSDRDGTGAIWIKNNETGSLRKLLGSGSSSFMPIFSPDDSKLLYFEYPLLFVKNLETGELLKTIVDTDGYLASWSPDGSRIAYINYSKGVGELMIYNLDTQETRQLTASGTNKWMPSWSPDGKQIVLAEYWYGKPNPLWIVDLNGNSRLLETSPSYIWAVEWKNSGELLYSNDTTFYSVIPTGTFKVIGVMLNPGGNALTAIATDSNGNSSKPSDPIQLVLDTSLLPDVSISADDIYIYPEVLKPGEDVAVNAVVRNNSQVQVDNLDVAFYLWDSAGNLQLIKTETLPYLSAQGTADVNATFPAMMSGTQTVIVMVDPQDAVKEANESNNVATTEVYATGREEISLLATLDAIHYETKQNVTALVSIRNSSIPTDGTLSVKVEDSAGNIVSTLDNRPQTISYGISDSIFTWNTGSTFTGSYQLHAVFTGVDGSVVESKAPFDILPEIKVVAGILTDKNTYSPRQDVGMTVSFKNSGANYIIPQLRARVRILDPLNNELFSGEQTAVNLMPNSVGSLPFTWNVGLSPQGAYSAKVDVYAGDRLVASGNAGFNIQASVSIGGSIKAVPSVAFIGGSITANFILNNNGNSDANGTAAISLIDPYTLAVVASSEQSATISMGGTISGTASIPTTGLSLQNYLITLRYISQEVSNSISSSFVQVKDGLPPAVTIASPQVGVTYTTEVAFSIFASDDTSGVGKVEYSIDNGAWKTLPLADPSKGRYSASWTPTTTDNGSHTVFFRGTDQAGNACQPVSVSFSVQNDFTPPVLNVSALADGSFTNNQVLNIAGSVSDDTGVKEVTINGTIITINADGSFSYALQLVPGSNVVEVKASDLAGNSVTNARTINLDQKAPLLIILTPADNSKTGTSPMDVTGTVDESSTVTVKVGGIVQTTAMNGNGFASSVTLVPGINTIEVTATDLANNTSSQKRTVIYDDQKPALAISEPGQDIRTNKANVTVRGTVSDPYTEVSVTVSVDDQTFTPIVINGGFEQAISLSAEKSYAITVTATNEVGRATSSQRNVIYDITPPTVNIDPVASPMSQTSQAISGVREEGATIVVSCATATVADIEYLSANTWRTTLSGFTAAGNSVVAIASDAAGNDSAATTAIIYDITPPTGSVVINGGAGITASNQVMLSLAANDESGVFRMRFSNDGSVWSDPETYATTRGWFFTTGDGLKRVYVSYQDMAGNWSVAPIVADIVLDTIPPVFSASPGGGIYNGPQSVTLSANESAVIHYTVDGSSPNMTSAIYQTPIQITSDTTLRFMASDSVGNLSDIKTESYTIDTLPPSLTVSTLADGSYTNNQILNIAGMATDASGIVSLALNGATVPQHQDSSFSQALVLQPGANTVTVVATDLVGNSSTDSRTINLDMTAPRLTVDTPADNAKTATDVMNVTGTVDETSTVMVKLGTAVQQASLNGTGFSAPVTLIPGINTVDVTATDLAGNTSTQKRTVVYDDQKPSLAVVEPPQDIRTNQSGLILRGTVSDPYTLVGVTVTMDDQSYTPPVTGGAFEQQLSFTQEKSYAIVVTATNEVGSSATTQRNVIYDITPPTLAINPVQSPTTANSVLISGTRETDVAVTVTCPTATVGTIVYPTASTWQVQLSAMSLGEHVVTAQATDAASNVSTASAGIIVQQSGADIILTPSPAIIWPSNHKMVPVTINGVLNVPLSDIKSLKISLSDEYGEYNFTNLKLGGTLLLEAWRNGNDLDGRKYTFSAVLTRKNGAKSTATAVVLVPHDMSGNGECDEDGHGDGHEEDDDDGCDDENRKFNK